MNYLFFIKDVWMNARKLILACQMFAFNVQKHVKHAKEHLKMIA